MEVNPYAELINKLREDLLSIMPAMYRFGEVISINPLKIEIGGTVQEKDDLLRNYSYYPDIGDRVLLMPIENEQRYIILCKVVKS